MVLSDSGSEVLKILIFHKRHGSLSSDYSTKLYQRVHNTSLEMPPNLRSNIVWQLWTVCDASLQLLTVVLYSVEARIEICQAGRRLGGSTGQWGYHQGRPDRNLPGTGALRHRGTGALRQTHRADTGTSTVRWEGPVFFCTIAIYCGSYFWFELYSFPTDRCSIPQFPAAKPCHISRILITYKVVSKSAKPSFSQQWASALVSNSIFRWTSANDNLSPAWRMIRPPSL